MMHDVLMMAENGIDGNPWKPRTGIPRCCATVSYYSDASVMPKGSDVHVQEILIILCMYT
jgi:hypothetical protein